MERRGERERTAKVKQKWWNGLLLTTMFTLGGVIIVDRATATGRVKWVVGAPFGFQRVGALIVKYLRQGPL